jgi:hypothetical protein
MGLQCPQQLGGCVGRVPEVPHRLQDGFFSLGMMAVADWSRNVPGRITATLARASGASTRSAVLSVTRSRRTGSRDRPSRPHNGAMPAQQL